VIDVSKCAGSESRFVTADDITCAACGALVEIFSDEQRRRCPSCGAVVTREAMPCCAAWCPSARSCLGAKRYDELVASGVLDGIENRD
jgi:predicted RNA-binding Zn-ribbon protein involved in translation (DUF1610 family)